MKFSEKRHLIYHMYPRIGGLWKFNAILLKQHLKLFNGKKTMYLAIDEKTEAAETVMEVFNHSEIEFHAGPNHALHETGPFIEKLMPSVANEEGVTFYAHSKGAGYGRLDLPYISNWAEKMYHHNLQPSASDMLEYYEAAGIYRRKMPHGISSWHYSGTFFWFRNSSVFENQKRDWRIIEPSIYGVETYLGSFIPYDHALCIYGDDAPDLYHQIL